MSKNFFPALVAILSVWCLGCAAATAPAEPEVEVGSIQWGRDFEQAKQTSAGSGKPLMLLFQEVPG